MVQKLISLWLYSIIQNIECLSQKESIKKTKEESLPHGEHRLRCLPIRFLLLGTDLFLISAGLGTFVVEDQASNFPSLLILYLLMAQFDYIEVFVLATHGVVRVRCKILKSVLMLCIKHSLSLWIINSFHNSNHAGKSLQMLCVHDIPTSRLTLI